MPWDFKLENCRNIPFWINVGERDSIDTETHKKIYKKARQRGYKNWEFTEHTGMGHSFRINWDQIEKWLLCQIREEIPPQIDFVTDDIDASKAYWLSIKRFADSTKDAKICGKINDQTINIQADNVFALAINFQTLSDICGDKIKILKDDQNIYEGKIKGEVFNWEEGCSMWEDN